MLEGITSRVPNDPANFPAQVLCWVIVIEAQTSSQVRQ